MDSRLFHNKNKLGISKFRLFCYLSSFIILIFLATFPRILPGTYGWLHTKSTSSGTIHNATSSELVDIQMGETQYEEACKIKSTVTIKNISNAEIPMKIQLVTSKQVQPLADIIVQANSSYTTEPAEINLQDGQCKTKQVKYRIIGFHGYIDEAYVIQIDDQRLQGTVRKPGANQSNGDEKLLAAVQSNETKTNTNNSGNSPQGSDVINNPQTAGMNNAVDGQSSPAGIDRSVQNAAPSGNEAAAPSLPSSLTNSPNQTQGNGSQASK